MQRDAHKRREIDCSQDRPRCNHSLQEDEEDEDEGEGQFQVWSCTEKEAIALAPLFIAVVAFFFVCLCGMVLFGKIRHNTSQGAERLGILRCAPHIGVTFRIIQRQLSLSMLPEELRVFACRTLSRDINDQVNNEKISVLQLILILKPALRLGAAESNSCGISGRS